MRIRRHRFTGLRGGCRPPYRAWPAALPILVLLVTTCTEAPTGLRGLAHLAVQPVVQEQVDLAAFNLVIDAARVVVVRPPAQVVRDTSVAFAPEASTLELDILVPLVAAVEELSVTVELLGGGQVLFGGTQTVTVQAGPPEPGASVQIPLSFIGPGLDVAAVVVEPADSIVTLNATLPFRVAAFDAAGDPVVEFYAAWSVTTPEPAIDRFGVLQAPGARGSTYVVARTPTDVADSTLITFVPVPTAVEPIEGGGQSLPIASTATLVARVVAADGLGVKGIPVQFQAVSGGGVVEPAEGVTDGDGLVTATVTLGTVAGSHAFEAAVSGLQPATFTLTALPGPISAGTSVVTTSSASIPSGSAAIITLQARDGSGNDIASGGATVAFAHAGGSSTGIIGPTSDNGDGTYTATFTGVTAGTPTTISATVNGTPVTTPLPAIAVTAGGVASVVVSPAAATLDAVGATQGFSAAAFDANANPVGGASFSWSSSNGSVATVEPATGVATAQGNGTAEIRATAGGVTGTAQLTVAQVVASVVVSPAAATLDAVGATQGFSAAALDANANPVAGVSFTWSSSNGLVATVDPATGVATAQGNGTAEIRATVGGVTGTGQLTVAQVVASIAFTVHPSDAFAGVAFDPPVTVSALDANGNVATNFADDVTVVRNDLIDCFATLLGTTTVTAAGGVAVFADLHFEQACPSMQLEASSVSHVSPRSNTFNITAGPAATIVLIAGDGQVAPVGGTLAAPLTVRVTDAFGNGVPGETVLWAVAAGGGSLQPANSTTDGGGFTSSQWTVGQSPGTNLAQASSGKLAGSPVLFTATATPLGTSATWTGAINDDWSNGGNWSTGLKPVSTDNVFVPQVSTNQPVVSVTDSVGDLIMELGAAMTIGAGATLEVGRDVAAGAVIGPGVLRLTGARRAGVTLSGAVPTVEILGAVALSGGLTVSGDLTILDAGSLDLNGQGAFVGGNFATGGGGTLRMANDIDQLVITGTAGFHGGSTAGLLSAGLVVVGADFTASEATAPESFAPSGTHTVILNGFALQRVQFFGAEPLNRFQNLHISNPGSVEPATPLAIAGDLVVVGGGIFDVGGQTVDVAGALLTLEGGVLRMDAAADLLTVWGDAFFAGGSESGLLGNGLLQIAGNFSQNGIPGGGGSFEGASLHVVELNGTGAQTVFFEDPTGSHFGNLLISNPSAAGVTFQSDVFAAGQLQTPQFAAGAIRTIVGQGHTLRVWGLDTDSLLLDNVPLVVDDGSQVSRFNSVTLQNYPADATQLTFNRRDGMFPLNDVNFVQLNVGDTGLYVTAVDNDAVSPFLTIEIRSTNITNGFDFTTTSGGAEVIWR